MKNFLLVIALAFCLSACDPSGPIVSPVVAPNNPVVVVTPVPAPIVTPAPVVPSPVPTIGPAPSPTPVAVPFLKLGTLTGTTAAENVMFAQAAVLLNQVLAMPCYKAHVLASNYTENLGLTPPAIWTLLTDGPVVVNGVMYTGSWWDNHVNHTDGYENDPGTVYVNRYFINTPYLIADVLAHEGEGHSKGFSHYYVKATSEPYGMNAVFEACAPTPQ